MDVSIVLFLFCIKTNIQYLAIMLMSDCSAVFSLISPSISCSKIIKKGVLFLQASERGILVSQASERGILVSQASERGILVSQASERGILVSQASERGILVSQASERGILVSQASERGILVSQASERGILVSQASGRGIFVSQASGRGILVSQISERGIFPSQASEKNTIQIICFTNLILCSTLPDTQHNLRKLDKFVNYVQQLGGHRTRSFLYADIAPYIEDNPSYFSNSKFHFIDHIKISDVADQYSDSHYLIINIPIHIIIPFLPLSTGSKVAKLHGIEIKYPTLSILQCRFKEHICKSNCIEYRSVLSVDHGGYNSQEKKRKNLTKRIQLYREKRK